MKRRFRFRRLLKWTGAVVCVLILLTAAVNVKWVLRASDGRSWIAGVKGGSVAFQWGSDCYYVFGGGIAVPYRSWKSSAQLWSDFGLWPHSYSYRPLSDRSLVSVPLWILFVLIGGPTAWLWRLDRRRVIPGCCAKCGYNLTGNVSGRCPECGAPAEVLP